MGSLNGARLSRVASAACGDTEAAQLAVDHLLDAVARRVSTSALASNHDLTSRISAWELVWRLAGAIRQTRIDESATLVRSHYHAWCAGQRLTSRTESRWYSGPSRSATSDTIELGLHIL